MYNKQFHHQTQHKGVCLDYHLDYEPETIWIVPHTTTESRTLPLYFQEIGHTFAGKDYYMKREHMHSYLIGYIVKGEAELTYNETTTMLIPGTAIWISCEQPHIIKTAPGCEHLSILWVHFNGHGALSYYDIFCRINGSGGALFHDFRGALYADINLLISSYSHPEVSIVKDVQACQIATRLCSTMIAASSSIRMQKRPQYINDIASYMQNHLEEDITLKDLSEHFQFSPSHLQKQFKATFGISPNSYLTITRLTKARHLLKTTNLPVNEIATLCGFNNSNYFVRCFKTHEGVTPLVYRKSGHTEGM